MLPTNTTNITGLRAWTLGLSLRKLSITAGQTIDVSNTDRRARAVSPDRMG
jgi:hypothetical protein